MHPLSLFLATFVTFVPFPILAAPVAGDRPSKITAATVKITAQFEPDNSAVLMAQQTDYDFTLNDALEFFPLHAPHRRGGDEVAEIKELLNCGEGLEWKVAVTSSVISTIFGVTITRAAPLGRSEAIGVTDVENAEWWEWMPPSPEADIPYFKGYTLKKEWVVG
ncbi:MAG: hypothetical protein Q9226_003866 [Calogaya cf. arnoldii]